MEAPEEDRRRYLRRRPRSGVQVRIPGVQGPYVVGLSPAGMRTVSESGLDEAEGDREAVDVTLQADGETLRVLGRMVWHEILLTPEGRRFVSGVEFLGVEPDMAARLQHLADGHASEWLVGGEEPV